MEKDEKTKIESEGLRRIRLEFFFRRLYRNWKVYYKSGYGKAGFYIIVFFVVLTVLAPVLTFHNPMNFVAPLQDTYTAKVEMTSPVGSNFTVNDSILSTTSINSQGSYLLYTTAKNGSLYGIGLGATSYTAAGKFFDIYNPDFGSSYKVFPVSVVPVSNYNHFISSGYSSLQYNSYFVISSTNGTWSKIVTGEITWSGGSQGYGTPSATNVQLITLKYPLINPAELNSLSLSQSPPTWVPFDNLSALSSGFLPALVITEGLQANNTINVSSFFLNSNIMNWHISIPAQGYTSKPILYGSFFSPSQFRKASVIIIHNNNIMSYSMVSGKQRWNSTLPITLNYNVQPVIPTDYQISVTGSSMMFLAGQNQDTLYGVYLANGTGVNIASFSDRINGIVTSQGSSGFPSYIMVETNYSIYSITGIGKVSAPFNINKADGKLIFNPLYIEDKTSAIFASNKGLLMEVSSQLGKDAALWTLVLPSSSLPIQQPILFRNAETGRTSISFISAEGMLNIYASAGVDRNPIPPTLNSPSGNIYLFGTNSDGNDLWSQYIASFPTDWEFGISVAIGVMVISVLIAMIVGYAGPITSSVFETISLVVYLIPGLAFLIALASVLGPSEINIIIVLTVIGWPFTALTMIGIVRQIKSRTFVEAAKVSGTSTWQILIKHMLPNMTPLLVYFLALAIGGAVAGVATLQFLGIAPLTIPTWGGMLQPIFNNYFLAAQAPWWVLPPSITITAFIMAFIFVSRGLDEVVNPRLRRQ